MIGRRLTAVFLLATIFLLTAGIASADSSLWDRLQIHGFASQAVVKTSHNRYFGDSPDTSFDFTELGLNASYQLDANVLFASQVLVRRAGDMYDGTPSFDYGLGDVTLVSARNRRLGVRVGRIKNPLGLYNETRDVPFTRPGIFLPQVVYFDKVRNLFLSSDGAMLYGETFAPWGNLSLTFGGGRPIVDENVEWIYLGADYDGSLDRDGIMWIGRIWYETPDKGFKAGLSGADGGLRFDPGEYSILGPGNIGFTSWIASLQYNTEDFTLSAEYTRIPSEWRKFGPIFPLQRQSLEGYYLQGQYRLRPDVELILRYEEGFSDRNDRNGKKQSEMTGGLTPPFDFYSKILTAGARWDILPNLMLRVEYQRHKGTFAASIRENPDPSRLHEDWDVFAASISVRF